MAGELEKLLAQYVPETRGRGDFPSFLPLAPLPQRHPGYIENVRRPSGAFMPSEDEARDVGDFAAQGKWGPALAGTVVLGAGAMGPRKGAPPPVRAYHGTRAPGNIRFEPHGDYEVGPHFGSRDQAMSRLEYSGDHSGKGLGDTSVIPVDLRLRNPLTIRDPGMFDVNNLPTALEATRQFSPEDIKRLSRHEQYFEGLDDAAAYRRATANFYKDLRELLASKGYDSIRYRNEGEHPEMTALMRQLGAAPGHNNVGERVAEEAGLWAKKAALEERLRREGEYSYVPLNQGSVFSALTGKPLFAAPVGAAGIASMLNQYSDEPTAP